MTNQINKILIWSDNFPKRCCVPLILEIAPLHLKLYFFSYVLLEMHFHSVNTELFIATNLSKSQYIRHIHMYTYECMNETMVNKVLSVE